MIGSESKSCPHCGRAQNPMMRLDISDGSWRKDEDIFAERFELQDIVPLMQNGLNIQESQNAILLEGGAVVDILDAGFYQTQDIEKVANGDRSLVMVDRSEFVLPICVEKVRTSDDVTKLLGLPTLGVVTMQSGMSGDNSRNYKGAKK